MPFSVAMCVYGKDDPANFRVAVESVLCQTAKPDEIVLVVDGPVPSALGSVISEYEGRSDFSVIYLPKNMGHGVARDTGLKRCSNDLVALMDADDISVPDRFEQQLKLFREQPHLSVVGGNIAEFIGEKSNVIGLRRVPMADPEIKLEMKRRCPINQVTAMFKRRAIDSVGGYIDWYCEEDYYLWLRLMLNGHSFGNVDRVLVNVRIGEDMYGRRGGWKYFRSEARLQRFMLENQVIPISTYLVNVAKRALVQVLMPNGMRGWAFRKFAREKTA